MAYPEYAAFVDSNNGTKEEYFEPLTAASLLEQNVESYQSLLNTDNMRAFYSDYELGNFDEIILRFGLKNET